MRDQPLLASHADPLAVHVGGGIAQSSQQQPASYPDEPAPEPANVNSVTQPPTCTEPDPEQSLRAAPTVPMDVVDRNAAVAHLADIVCSDTEHDDTSAEDDNFVDQRNLPIQAGPSFCVRGHHGCVRHTYRVTLP